MEVPLQTAPAILSDATPLAGERAAFQAFNALAEALSLGWEQRCALLDLPRSTYHRWLGAGFRHLDRDKRDRLAYVLAIYHFAGTAFPGGGGARGWLTRPNAHPAFAGGTPLARMLQGRMEDLLATLQVARAAEAIWS